jgi:hypothetical protein
VGRRRIEITKEMLANVENMAGRGATKKQIALALGISF